MTQTWQSGAYRWQNLFRKEERDWKMVYLARAEDTDTAEIEWKFDFSDRNLTIKDIQLKFDLKIYESGQIDVSFLHKGKNFGGFYQIDLHIELFTYQLSFFFNQ